MNRTKSDELAVEQGYYFDEEAANAIINFANKIFKPQYVRDFKLLDWQTNFLKTIYGWKTPEGNRRFKFVNLHISKKQGKTLLVSLISAFELLKSREPSPFIVTGSVSKENAAQVFNEIRYTLTQAKLLKFAKVTANQKKIVIPNLNAEYRSLASDGDRVQGLNASLVILDECHAHKSASLYDSLKYAPIARTNGLLIAISTAGDDPSGWYHAIYSKSKRILSGEETDVTYYAEIYESDPDKDPQDEAEWLKANPSLGISFSREQFRLDLEAAKKDVGEFLRFKRYRLNQWVRASELAYFDVALYDRGKLSPPDLTNKDCWLGVDLSQTTDPSSVAAVWHLGQRRYFVKSWSWTAAEGVKLREKTTFPRYQQFSNEGWMKITSGGRIDDRLILDHILDLCKANRVKSVTFDPTSAIVLMSMVEKETGIEVLRLPQTHRYFNGPMKELNKAIAENRIHHDGNNWLRYCLSNVRIDEDRQGNIRPTAKGSLDHIDGAIALLLAFSNACQASASEAIRPSVYDKRGILTI